MHVLLRKSGNEVSADSCRFCAFIYEVPQHANIAAVAAMGRKNTIRLIA